MRLIGGLAGVRWVKMSSDIDGLTSFQPYLHSDNTLLSVGAECDRYPLHHLSQTHVLSTCCMKNKFNAAMVLYLTTAAITGRPTMEKGQVAMSFKQGRYLSSIRQTLHQSEVDVACVSLSCLQIPVSKPKLHPKAKMLPKAMTKEERREMLNKLHKAERQAKWEAEHANGTSGKGVAASQSAADRIHGAGSALQLGTPAPSASDVAATNVGKQQGDGGREGGAASGKGAEAQKGSSGSGGVGRESSDEDHAAPSTSKKAKQGAPSLQQQHDKAAKAGKGAGKGKPSKSQQ
eukprot:scaffold122145_cov17-Tisochrysis_lutea.AAC.2